MCQGRPRVFGISAHLLSPRQATLARAQGGLVGGEECAHPAEEATDERSRAM